MSTTCRGPGITEVRLCRAVGPCFGHDLQEPSWHSHLPAARGPWHRPGQQDCCLLITGMLHLLQLPVSTQLSSSDTWLCMPQSCHLKSNRHLPWACCVQEAGLDTVDANRALGLPDDCREYTSVRNILDGLNVKSIKLIVGVVWLHLGAREATTGEAALQPHGAVTAPATAFAACPSFVGAVLHHFCCCLPVHMYACTFWPHACRPTTLARSTSSRA